MPELRDCAERNALCAPHTHNPAMHQTHY